MLFHIPEETGPPEELAIPTQSNWQTGRGRKQEQGQKE